MIPIDLIIDTDPGMDDAVAILTALGCSDQVAVRLLTTVGGNVDVEKCTNNALGLLELASRPEIPVYQGCPNAILQPGNPVPDIHGETGLGKARLPATTIKAAQKHAVPALIDAILSSPGKVTIAALAPLTNIALALIMAPQIANRIEKIVIIGGAMNGGNITPFATYNLHSDPHAARIVINSRISVVMIGLDTLRQLKPDIEWLHTLAGSGSRISRFVAEIWEGFSLGFNDAAAILYIIKPQLFTDLPMRIEIECCDSERLGQTIPIIGEPNVQFVTSVDRTAAMQKIRVALA
jgi:purine nucleosidase